MNRRTKRLRSCFVVTILAAPLIGAAPAQSDSADARQIVREMSAYIAAQKDLSGDFDVALDVTTPQLEKITFQSSGTVLMSRPGKMHSTRTGGYSEMELVGDGTTATVIDRAHGAYAQASYAGTIDSLIDTLRTTYSIEMPAGDLLMTDSYDRLMAGVVEAKHIGVGVIDGHECEHLAFRNDDTDWQLWVRTGPDPLPCKYLISSKKVVGYPTYTIEFRNWSTGKRAGERAFHFSPTAGLRKVGFDQMSAVGELPPPAKPASGGQ